MTYNLEVCGINMRGARDSVDEEPEWTQEARGRTLNGELFDEFTVRKRLLRTRTIFVATAEAYAFRGLVEGHGHNAAFTDDVRTGKGIAAELASAYTLAASGGKHGPKVTVTSGGTLGWELGARMAMPGISAWGAPNGFTLLAWVNVGGTIFHQVAKGAVVVTRGASANPAGVKQYRDGVLGSWGMGNYIDISATGRVRVTGHNEAGAAAAREYSSFAVLPFEVPDDWVNDLFAFHLANEWPRLQNVSVDGRAIENGPMLARVRASRLPQRGIVRDGVFDDTARLFELEITEV